MKKGEIIFDEHLLKLSAWERLKLWIWQRKNYKRISIWIRKEDEDE